MSTSQNSNKKSTNDEETSSLGTSTTSLDNKVRDKLIENAKEISGEVDGSEECSRVSAEDPSITGTPTSSPAEPVVEVFLTDDLADSMLNPPTDPECSDEETLKLKIRIQRLR